MLRRGDLDWEPGQLLTALEFPGAPGWASPWEGRGRSVLLFTDGKWWGKKGVLGLKARSAFKEPLRLQLIYFFFFLFFLLLMSFGGKNIDLGRTLAWLIIFC